MSKRLIIAGAGGFGRGMYGWVTSSRKFLDKFDVSDVAFVDDTMSLTHSNIPIVSTINEYVPELDDLVICAIGSPRVRKSVVDKLRERGAVFQTFVDDRAIIGPQVTLGAGAVICPGTVISAGAEIGEQVHINFNCSIGHDTAIGAFSTLSPSVNLMGEIKVEDSVFFGGSAAVLPRLRIGADAEVGAGAVVTKNVPERVIVKGVPGRWGIGQLP